MPTLSAPFPWFGGKSRVADLVWARFGKVDSYIEPFFGSGAVLLGAPAAPAVETVNDNDCYLANFWRAVTCDPNGVAHWADQPVNEADLHARHCWLLDQTEFRARMMSDPLFFDVRIAGWWVWGICNWIGGGWCSPRDKIPLQLPSLSVDRGIFSQQVQKYPTGRLPHLSDAGTGVLRASLRTEENGVQNYFQALQNRLRNVRVACGNWDRITGDSITRLGDPTGVFLDPPYDEGEHTVRYSGGTGSISADVRAWAIENGTRRDLRIALCGYAGEHAMPDDWEEIVWKANGGYGNQGTGKGRDNALRERIWFSPHCTTPQQISMF